MRTGRGAEREFLVGAANQAGDTVVEQGWRLRGTGHWPGFRDGTAVHALVGSFAPNAFGSFDVHDDVREWCRDGQRAFEQEGRSDPLTLFREARQPMNRGEGLIEPSRASRSAIRSHDPPAFAFSGLGLRAGSNVGAPAHRPGQTARR